MPTGTSLNYVAATNHRPLPTRTTTTTRATHRPWCTDCKRTVDLEPTGLCTPCTRANATRTAATERRTQAEAETAAQAAAAAKETPSPTTSSNSHTPGKPAPKPSHPTQTKPTKPSATPSTTAPENSTNTSPTSNQEFDAQIQHATTVLTRTAHATNHVTRQLRNAVLTAVEALHLFTELYPDITPTTTAPSRTRNNDPFPHAEAQRLYLEENLSCPQIAGQLGYAISTIQRKLKQAGTPMRDDRGTRSGGTNRTKPTPEQTHEVTRLYLDQQLSTATIGEQLQVDRRVIRRILTNNGVTIRPPAHEARTHLTAQHLADIARAYRQGDSLNTIATRLRIKKDRVRTALTDAGIPIRTKGGSTVLGQRIEALGVTAHQIKTWALNQGITDRIPPGLISRDLIDAYATAHPTTEGAHTS